MNGWVRTTVTQTHVHYSKTVERKQGTTKIDDIKMKTFQKNVRLSIWISIMKVKQF